MPPSLPVHFSTVVQHQFDIENCQTRLLPLLANWHALNLLAERTPILRLQLSIFDSFLAPVLMQPTDMMLGRLEDVQLVSDTLLDEHSTCVLLHN